MVRRGPAGLQRAPRQGPGRGASPQALRALWLREAPGSDSPIRAAGRSVSVPGELGWSHRKRTSLTIPLRQGAQAPCRRESPPVQAQARPPLQLPAPPPMETRMDPTTWRAACKKRRSRKGRRKGIPKWRKSFSSCSTSVELHGGIFTHLSYTKRRGGSSV